MPAVIKHIVVVTMENRSFDHMLGALKAVDPRIDGLDGTESNPDSQGKPARVQPLARFQGQLDPDPGHSFPEVDFQMYAGDMTPTRVPTMQGFVRQYFQQRKDVKHSWKIMYYFKPEKLPVLTTLATEFAVFNRWFSSIPGPTLCNRAFAHYGSSFGHVRMQIFYPNTQYKSVYQRPEEARQPRGLPVSRPEPPHVSGERGALGLGTVWYLPPARTGHGRQQASRAHRKRPRAHRRRRSHAASCGPAVREHLVCVGRWKRSLRSHDGRVAAGRVGAAFAALKDRGAMRARGGTSPREVEVQALAFGVRDSYQRPPGSWLERVQQW